jgi:VanZ family protein
MKPSKRIIAAGISLLVYALISLLSSIHGESLPSGIPDWIPHCGEYFLLAFFFIQAWARPRRVATMAATLFILAALGLLDEWHQRSVPGRVFSLLDLAFDTAGALAGMAAYRVLEHWTARNGAEKGRRWPRFFLLHR